MECSWNLGDVIDDLPIKHGVRSYQLSMECSGNMNVNGID